MRKNTRNEKVLKAITIGLATMIAITSTPVTALADDGEGEAMSAPAEEAAQEISAEQEAAPEPESQPAPESESASWEESEPQYAAESESESQSESAEESLQETVDESQSESAAESIEVVQAAPEPTNTASTDTITVPEAIAGCETVAGIIAGTEENAHKDAPEALINTAIEETSKLSDKSISTVLKEVVEKEKENQDDPGKNLIDKTAENVQNAKTKLEDGEDSVKNLVEKYEEEVDKIDVEELNKNISTINSEMEKYQESLQSLSELPETVTTEEQAKAITGIVNAYNAADEARNKAAQQLKAAQNSFNEANDALENAKQDLQHAKGDAKAAHEKLLEAQEKVNGLKERVDDLNEAKERLEKLEKQYNAFLVRYFNAIKCADYNQDGSLNYEKSLTKAGEWVKGKANSSNVGDNDNVYALGRQLMEDWIKYKLEDEGAEIIEFAKKEGNAQRKTAASGEVVEEANNYTAKLGNKHDLYMNYPGGNNGAGHCIKVVYKINNEEKTEYFNYVFKQDGRDKLDLEKGPVFLAKVSVDGSYSDAGFLYDDYEELQKALNDIRSYEAAKAAVDASEAKVRELNEEIDRLNKVSINRQTLDNLESLLKVEEKKLEDAKDDYDKIKEKADEAQEFLDNLEDELADPVVGPKEDTKPAPSVDVAPSDDDTVLPVINTTENTDAVDDVDDSSSESTVFDLGDVRVTVPASLPTLGFSTTTVNVSPAFASGPSGSGVAGVNRELAGDAVEISGKSNDVAAKFNQAVNTINQAKKAVKEGKKIVKINDEEVPLAALPTEDGVHISWWWLLIILLLGEMGREMYKKHKEKMEAAKVEANNINE